MGVRGAISFLRDAMPKMKFGFAIAAELALAVSGYGTTSVQITKQDVTPTQAIIRVKTDQPGFCTYRLSEGSSFNAMVNDVNPSLFSGANSDARPGSIITGIDSTSLLSLNGGSEHVFVAGTRTAARAADGKFYSRALQANTLHWVGVTCGSDAEVSTTFQTLNLPLGNDGPELMPFDATAFGNVAVPTIDWINRSTTYNDPLWGTQLHRMTDPTDIAFYVAENASFGLGVFTYALSSNGHWANPNNGLSASSSSLATCDTSSSCSTSDALALIAVIPSSATNYSANGAWDPQMAYLDFLVRMWGSGTDASAANRTVAVCWSINDQTCFTSSQNIVLAQTTAAFAGTAPQSWSVQSPWSGASATTLTNIAVASGRATVNFASAHGLSAGGQICVNGIRNSVTTAQGGNGLNGCHTIASTPTSTSLTFASNAVAATYTDSELIASPNFPQAQWAPWGTPPLHNSVGLRGGGTVTATSGALVLSSSGQTISNFDPTWVSGTKIYIAGSSPTCASNLCTVSSMTDAQHLTLVERLTISGASWTSANFSLLIKKTTSSGTVSLSAGYDFVYGTNYSSGLDGSGDICNSNYVTVNVDANGNSISPSLQGYLCVANANRFSNATTPIYLFIPSTGETRLIARNYQASVNDYRAWIGWHPTNGAAWFINYPGQSVFQVVYSGDFRALTPGFPQATTEAGTPEQLTFTDIFAGAGHDMSTQIANCVANGTCNTAINPALFGVPPSPPQTGAAIRGNYMVMCGGVIGGGQDSPGYITTWNIGPTPATLAWAGYTFDAFPVGYAGIHACLSFGNGQFNWNGLNGSAGQLRGTMSGPWQATPTMYDRGKGYTPNTSVLYTDGFDCPSGLSSQWQALGAKPMAQGGVPRCLKLKVPGDFCSTHATAAESAAYPCPWNSASNYSLIKPIAEGDSIGDTAYGFVSYGEKMLVVKVTRNSGTEIDLLVFRYSSQFVTPNSSFTCGTYGASEWNHSNGWTMMALPYHGCPGSNYWINAADSTHTYTAENPNILGVHSDFGQGSSGYTYVEGATLSGYLTRANQPMPQQIGAAPTGQIIANPKFGSSQLPDTFLQSYPSKRQQSALAPPSEMNWALDVRHYNPSVGNSAETPEALFGNTVGLVSGYSHTYLVTFPSNQRPDPKVTGFVAWAGYHMLADASGPNSASSFGDSPPWHYCYAFVNGECISSSTAGQMYVSVPFDFSSTQCLVNTYAYNTPCISNNYPYGFWVTQFNTTRTDNRGVTSRRLTSALVAPGRQYNFTNAKPTPDGRWILVQGQWLGGQRTDMFWMKLPPFPATISDPGAAPGATNLRLHLSGVRGDVIRVAFGYAENGKPANFFCTSRAEACYTSSSETTSLPFAYASEAQSYTGCGSGCTITIPAAPGRALYYQVQRQDRLNNTTSVLGVVAVQ
jgi:hypothetical protein